MSSIMQKYAPVLLIFSIAFLLIACCTLSIEAHAAGVPDTMSGTAGNTMDSYQF